MIASLAVLVAATVAFLAGTWLARRTARLRERLLAERLAALRKELATAYEQIATQERLSSLGLLAAGVAHEINNPMSYVTSNVRALAEDLQSIPGLPPELAEYVDDILPATLDGIQRVNAIVADLRSFSRQDPGDFAEFDLNAQVETALRLSGGALRHRARVVKNLARLPPAIGKPRQITQVLVNLVVNAAHAIRDEGTVTISTRCDPDDFVIEVRDTGVGMEPEVVRRLFTPFFTTKPVGEGTGLGLAVVHGIVRSHGGRISVRSAPGAGTQFTIHLPRVPPAARRQRRPPHPEAA